MEPGITQRRYFCRALFRINSRSWLISYKPEKLKPQDYPKDWRDLLDPKYKGQILLGDHFPTIGSQAESVKSKGAPVDSVMPDYNTGLEFHVMLTARAKSRNPSAGRLFVNYILSKEGNAVMNSDPGSLSVLWRHGATQAICGAESGCREKHGSYCEAARLRIAGRQARQWQGTSRGNICDRRLATDRVHSRGSHTILPH